MYSDEILRVEDLNITYQVRNIEAKNLFSSRKTNRQVIKGLDLVITDKGISSIVGKNGAGKTTLIKAMTGILYTKPGIIKILGQPLTQRKLKYSYGVLFSNKSSLLPEHSLLENINLTQALYNQSNKHSIDLDNYIRECGLWEIRKRPLKTYSLGEKIKAELINLFAFQPKLLFLDEPTIGLDIESQKYVRQILNKYVNDFHAHIILTSHNLKDIVELSQKTYLLDNGSLQIIELTGDQHHDMLKLEGLLG